MQDRLELQLLGGFAVKLKERSVDGFRSAKSRGLLAYVAAQPDRDHSRETLATLLWGDLPDTSAKTNLRVELSNLKQLLAAHPALEITRRNVRVHSGLAAIDLHEFQHSLHAYMALPTEAQGAALPRLVEALAHYHGEFLAGLHVGDADEFEDWQLLTREQVHEQAMRGLDALQVHLAEQGRWEELASAARRQLVLAPWIESAHRHVMQALAAQGQTQAALAQYARCCEILQEELGVEPAAETQELATRLGRGGAAAPFVPRHNLTQQLKPLIGREAETTRLHALVKTQRLVSLLGMGGVGKSRLAQAVAQAVAQAALHDFADGVWFAPLANLEAGEGAVERIALAIAAAIGFQVTDMQAPLSELATHLAAKQMLLVLDNWEHLIDAAPQVLETLFEQTPVHVLATSRVRLMYEGETPVHLDGLPVDDGVALFVERARRIVPDFATDENPAQDADIRSVCAQVAGLPLGIELAASWVEHYAVAEIGASLARMAAAPQRSDGLVDRHHQLRDVFEVSWQLLSSLHRQVLARVAVFRGGFDRSAAAAVAECSLGDLSMLLGHSLIQRVSAGRYDMHPLIQEYAEEKLDQDSRHALWQRHSTHYLTALTTTASGERTAKLLADLENLRRGWQYAILGGDAGLVAQAADDFSDFMQHHDYLADSHRLFVDAVTVFEQEESHRELVAKLLTLQSAFTRGLYGQAAYLPLQQRVLALSTDPRLLALAHQRMANTYAETGRWELADYHFDQQETTAQASGDTALYIEAVEGRIHINAIHFRGDLVRSLARTDELLQLLEAERAHIPAVESIHYYLLQTRCLVALRYGDYGLALQSTRTALALAERQQQHRVPNATLDLALVEQFAGYYEEAIDHNLQALAWAEAAGDVEEMGLLNANLCLTLRQAGRLEEALAYGQRAIEINESIGNLRIEGQARNRIGHSLLLLERWQEAYVAYGDAITLWDTLEHPNRYEAVAGRAAAAIRLDRRDEALALAEEALAFVEEDGMLGIVEPVRLLLHCEMVFTGVDDTSRARAVLRQAAEWVETIAGRINDDAVRATFLHQRADHHHLQARLAALDVLTA